MSESMTWVCVVTQDGKQLHTALGYTPEEAKKKATAWRDNKISDYPSAITGEPRLQFPKYA